MVIWVKTILLVALLVPVAQGVGTYDTGAGIQYTLKGAVSPNLVLLKNPINVSVLIGNQLVVT